MAGEIQAQRPTGETLYAVLLNEAGRPWNGTTFDTTPTAGEWANYAIALSEDSTMGYYRATMPSSTAGSYTFRVHKQVGGSPATTDPLVWTGEFYWNGTAVVGAHTVLSTGGSGPWGGASGSGAITWEYVVLDGNSDPLPDVFVWVTAENSSIVLASGHTDETGTVTFYLDAGTYDFYSRKGGYNFTNPDQETVS